MPKPRKLAKPPRPVKAWAVYWRDTGEIVPDQIDTPRAVMGWMEGQGLVRVLVVPLREPTDGEVEALAVYLYNCDESGPAQNWPWAEAPDIVRAVWKAVARAAWALGARPR